MQKNININEFEKIKLNDRRNKFRIDDKDGLLYHYRGWADFWKILKSDSFWATESRFSNDFRERSLGLELGKTNFGINCGENSYIMDRFIICLSEHKDRLGLWRGYASYGGVSLGLDVSMTAPYTVFSKPKNQEQENKSSINDGVICYLRPYSVRYYSKETNKETIGEVSLVFAKKTEKDDFELTRRFNAMIPYIKHVGFKEEGEWRLVVGIDDFEDGDKEMFEKHINYRENNNKRFPYICIKPGSFAYEKKRCVVRIFRKDDDRQLLLIDSKTFEGKLDYSPKVFECTLYGESSIGDKDDRSCFGCTRRKWYPGESSNKRIRCCYTAPDFPIKLCDDKPSDIIISQGKNQKELFNVVYNYIYRNPNKDNINAVKIWCEGHLPIREIIVGPCENQHEMIENIQHYCLHSDEYWLRCVSVMPSEIPYRTPVALS